MICILQARMSSNRLPKKMLKVINKQTLLSRVYCQLKEIRDIKDIVVATSINKEDDLIVNFCNKNNILFHRGSLNDVSKRIIEILNIYKYENFIRVNGDSPFISSLIIKKAIKIFKEENPDLVTNIFPRSYPKGLSIEILNSQKLISSYKNQNSSQKEHVTKYFYENSSNYKIQNFKYSKDCSNINLSVDTREDLKIIRKISKKIGNKQIDIDELINTYKYAKKEI